MRYDYDILVIGGGAAGLTAAKVAKGFGKRVAIIDKQDRLGGECTWTGCVPSKALIHAAEVAYQAQQAQQFGITSRSPVDTHKVMQYVQQKIQDVYKTHTPEVIQKLGIEVLFGNVVFTTKHTLNLDGKELSFNKAILATGSSPFIPNIEGLNTVEYQTNETFFNQKQLPKSLLILGGGAIGVELASACNRLGVQVAIIEMQKTILNKEDAELVAMLTHKFADDGIALATGMQATKVAKDNGNIIVTCADASNNSQQFSAEQLLIAVGRTPNIAGLHLQTIGIKHDDKKIIVNNKLQTSVKNIYACGDIVGPYLFSHMSWHQAVVAARNACVPIFKKSMDYKHVAWVTFTAPELAAAGLTEEQARAQYGDSITIYRRSYNDFDRAHTDNNTFGLAKVICNSKGYILGIHILGKRAGDSIQEAQLAKTIGMRYADLVHIIHPYPTYVESLWHESKKAYVDQLNKKWFIKVVKWFVGVKK